MRSILVTALFVTTAFAAAAQEPDGAALLMEGRRLLDTDEGPARQTLQRAAQVALETGNGEVAKRAYFYLARNEQVHMSTDPERMREKAEAARTYYERALAIDPQFAAAANNLADLLFTVYGHDELDEVMRHYQTAVAHGGELQAFYLTNYARAVAVLDANKAEALYRRALALRPDDAQAEEGLLRVVPGEQVVQHLQGLVAGNAFDRAQRLAVEHMQRQHDAGTKQALLVLTATTLAKQHVQRASFADSSIARELSKLEAEPHLRDGIDELFRFFAAERRAYGWWTRRGTESLSLLARELADQTWRAGDLQTAEWYATLALDITGGSSPEAFLALTDFHYRNGNTAALERLANRYGDEMFSEKNRMYAERNWERIYQFHVALGTIFSRLGWTKENLGIRSAIFQLERARWAAARYNEANPQKARIIVDTNVINLLAESYKKESPSSGRDLQLRLQSAEEYIDSDRASSATRILQPVAADPRLEQGQEKLRYDRLKGRIPYLGTMTPIAIPQPPTPLTPHAATPRVTRKTLVKLAPEGAAMLEPEVARKLEELLAAMQLSSEYDRTAINAQLRTLGVTRVDEQARKVVLRLGLKRLTVDYSVQFHP